MLTKEQIAELRETPLTGVNKVTAAMKLVGVTQVQLAAALGVTQPHISDTANGKYSALPLETARRFAEFFGCAIEDLFPPVPKAEEVA